MEIGPVLIAAVAAVAAILGIGFLLARRRPPAYGPDEIARGPDNPTVTTIARRGLVTTPFFENGQLVAKAKTFGRGAEGIALCLEGDETDYLFTTDGDWFEETRFRVKTDIRLRLLADGVPTVTAERLPDTAGGWMKGEDGGYTAAYQIDCGQGRFDLVRLKFARFALRRGGAAPGRTSLGIAAMPITTGIDGRTTSRIELPASLPLATRLFIALLVEIEDHERGGASWS
jgi:hypothetical protein